MIGSLILLPLKLTLKLTEAVIKKAIEAVIAERCHTAPPPAGAATPAREPAPPPARPAARAPAPQPPAPRPPAPAPAPSPPAPEHIEVPEELVGEFAEPGAEDGAGAQISVDPPWEGYAQMGARDVIDRLEVADSAELGAVVLYEQTHRQRATVIDAAQRRLRLLG